LPSRNDRINSPGFMTFSPRTHLRGSARKISKYDLVGSFGERSIGTVGDQNMHRVVDHQSTEFLY
ncbi:MAG TPA: hypothetical protein VMG63_17385, partial [Terriglobia bacterium]|nr:hypothetical protein [Terriglobia bacterium]